MAAADPLRLILVTGAAGNIGRYFVKHANKEKYKRRLMVRSLNVPEKVDPLKPHGEVIEAQMDKIETLQKACEGVHTVIHLAGQPSTNATWDTLRQDNIDGVYNLFLAAKKAGVNRVIFASSIHAISGYPEDTQVKTIDPVNPGGLYGVTKCFGEALARYMGEHEGLPTIAIRIGAYQPYSSLQDESKTVLSMNAWLSEPDAVQLFERCIEAPSNLKFAIVPGLSKNIFNRMDINSTRQLVDYDPQDNFFEEAEKFKQLKIIDTLLAHNVHDLEQKSGLRDKSPQ